MSDPNEHPVMMQVRFLRDLANRIEATMPGDAYQLRTISYALEFMFTATAHGTTNVSGTEIRNVRINAVDEKGRRVNPVDPEWEDFKKKNR